MLLKRTFFGVALNESSALRVCLKSCRHLIFLSNDVKWSVVTTAWLMKGGKHFKDFWYIAIEGGNIDYWKVIINAHSTILITYASRHKKSVEDSIHCSVQLNLFSVILNHNLSSWQVKGTFCHLRLQSPCQNVLSYSYVCMIFFSL